MAGHEVATLAITHFFSLSIAWSRVHGGRSWWINCRHYNLHRRSRHSKAQASRAESIRLRSSATAPHAPPLANSRHPQIQAGAIFPTRTARTVIQKKLEGSRYCTEEYINRIIDHYDRKTKTTFVSPEQSSVIKFGFNDDTDVDVGILKGRLTLTG